MHKGRGNLFREMMERQRLHAASGHYHGTHGNSSTIDFVILPQSYAESIRAATLLERGGRQLQHARVRRSLDQDPVMIRFEYAPDFFRPASRERPPLDMDLLCLAMTTWLPQSRIPGTGGTGNRGGSEATPATRHDDKPQMARRCGHTPAGCGRILRQRTTQGADGW